MAINHDGTDIHLKSLLLNLALIRPLHILTSLYYGESNYRRHRCGRVL